MKKSIYIASFLLSVGMLSLTSCNTNPPTEEMQRVKSLLVGVDWVLYCYCDSNLFENQLRNTYTISDLENTQLWYFTDTKSKRGDTKKGIKEESYYDYKMQVDSSGNVSLLINEAITGERMWKYYEIISITTDSLHLRYYGILSQYREGIAKHYYFVNYSGFRKRLEAENEKLKRAQEMMEGDWYLARSYLVTDYADGYTAENGETHTATETVYQEPYRALKIRTNSLPFNNDNERWKSSSFAIGSYADGKATYDITPGRYHSTGTQYYEIKLNDAGDVNISFYNFFPVTITTPQNGEPYEQLANWGARVVTDEQTSSMFVLETSYQQYEEHGTGNNTYTTKISDNVKRDYWLRQK